jgi:hypothetical protein
MTVITDKVAASFLQICGTGTLSVEARRLIKVKHIKIYRGERTLVFDKKDIREFGLGDMRVTLQPHTKLPTSKKGLYYDPDANALAVNLDENPDYANETVLE